MASNQIVKLLGVLALLLGIAYFSGAFEKAPTTMDLPSIEVDSNSVTRIEVISTSLTVVTEKASSTWQMKKPVEWLADSIAVKSFVRQLSDLRLKSVVAMTPDRYERYAVDSSAFVIKITDKSGEHLITMSPNGPEYSTVYMRINGDERVFSASPRLSVPFSAAQWRDKEILSLDPLAVLNITVSTPDESYTVNRESAEGSWVIQQSGSEIQSDSVAVSTWVNRFLSLKIDGFVEADIEYAETTHSVEFLFRDGSSVRLEAAQEESRFILTERSTDGTVYYLASSRAEPLFPSSQSLVNSE